MIKRENLPRAGVVSTRNWLGTPTGDQFQRFWCAEWLMETDKELEMVGLKSSDRWAAVAMDGEEILAIIPGCEVVAYMPCAKPPPANTYIFVKEGK